jgi:hypothetical protein
MVKQIKLINESSDLSEKFPFRNDIYSGEEHIQFNNRHPIYKTIMKLEFEDILRSFSFKGLQD